VSTISIWEAATLDRQGRVQLLPNVSTWIGRATGGSGVAPIAVSSEIATSAAALPSSFPGDPADRLVYATANVHAARLVTKDRAVSRHDPTRVIW
jgi:PIN domain nuclease of toxin-antitoxin system